LKKFWWFRPLLHERETDPTQEQKKSAAKLLVLSGIFFVVLQTTVLPYLPIVPDLLLVFCVYLALYHSSASGAAGAFFLGYSLDTCSGAPLGMHAFTLSLIFTFVTLTARRLWLRNPLSSLFIVSLALILKNGAFLLWGEFDQLRVALHSLVSGKMLHEAGVVLILTPVIFAILQRGEEFGYRA
jgi:rod shape-determining protein MreD